MSGHKEGNSVGGSEVGTH